MKRISLMMALALLVSGVAALTQTTHAHAATCTPSWRTVQTKGISTLYYGVFVSLGSVRLQRDGCGDIQAQTMAVGDGRAATAGSLTITNVATSTTIYTSTNLQGHGLVASIASPIFAGYGGVGITVTGSLTDPTIGTITATTTADYGT